MTVYLIRVLFVGLFVNGILGRRFGDEFYPQRNYAYERAQEMEVSVEAAVEKLSQGIAPQLEPNWPDSAVKFGQVSGLALNAAGDLLVFHRGPIVWDERTFSIRNVYQRIGDPPIAEPTVLVINDTGHLVDQWGENLFYMPHGITVDGEGNVWMTDVALHQVFKFTPRDKKQPALVLGEKFVPGDDDFHFCKPSAVSVMASGEFFVADGYCNTRIVKYAADGTKLLQWGRRSGSSPFVLSVPHALTLVPGAGGGALCVADRERGRVACFRAADGTYLAQYTNWLMGTRIFSVAYTHADGGKLYVVNGPSMSKLPVRGYVIDYESGRLEGTFAPPGGLSNPHDVVVSPEGDKVYVCSLSPFAVHRFSRHRAPRTPHAPKPTATQEVSVGRNVSLGAAEAGAGWRAWGGALGAAGAAAGAALLVLAALALLRARNTGRKSVSRRRWEYSGGEFQLRRLLARGRFQRVHSDDSEDEPAPMLPARA